MNRSFRMKVVRSQACMLRVGYSNVLIFLGIMAAGFVYKSGEIYEFSEYYFIPLAAMIFLVFVWLYSKAVAEISVYSDTLEIVTAFSELEFSFQEIQSISVGQIPHSKYVAILIRLNSHELPSFFHFVSPKSNIGDFDITASCMIDAFAKINDED